MDSPSLPSDGPSSPENQTSGLMKGIEKLKLNDLETKKLKKIDRHCAFCLTLVPGDEVKICSKCSRRAYCSKECQKADWKLAKEKPAFTGKIYGYGQGHKAWCGLPYGEEDLDWKVVPIEGKGLGIVALKDIPQYTRIIVDGLQSSPKLRDGFHPEIEKMVSKFSTTTTAAPGFEIDTLDKFLSNCVDTKSGYKVGLRIARVNHSCSPNSFLENELDYDVEILTSDRKIKKGEEITFAYLPLNEQILRKGNSGEDEQAWKKDLRIWLKERWDIVCLPSCVCRDEERDKLLLKINKESESCEANYMCKNVVEKMKEVLENCDKVGCFNMTRGILNYRAYKYARASLEMGDARTYFDMYINVCRSIFHPKGNILKKLERESVEF